VSFKQDITKRGVQDILILDDLKHKSETEIPRNFYF